MIDFSNISLITKIFLSFLGLKVLVQNYLDLRNVRSIKGNRKEVPGEFSGVVTPDEYQKGISYNLAKISFGKKTRTLNLIVF